MCEELFSAIGRGDVSAVLSLLQRDPSLVDCEDADEDSPLHAAAYANQPRLVDALMHYGADVDAAGCSNRRAIDCAAYEGHIEVVSALLRHNATIDWSDALCENALHKAATRGHGVILRMILTASQSDPETINQQNVLGDTPLHLAMANGNDECAQLLLSAGADTSIENFFGYKPTFEPKRVLTSANSNFQ